MSTKLHLAIDFAIFVVILLVANPSTTGQSIHEWLSLGFGAAIITHLVLHWNWLASVTKEFFKEILHPSRLNYVVDALFFIALTGTILSGILISRSVLPSLGISLNVNRNWDMVHKSTANALTILLAIHVGLHWKWIFNSLNRCVVVPVRSLFKRETVKPVASEATAMNKDQ